MSPIQSTVKTAILTAGFEENRRIRVFADGWTPQAARFAPDVLAGPLPELLALAGEAIEIGRAVVVFIYDLDEALTASERDQLWHAFGVPVFEQLLDDANELLATECEAHDGLHFLTPPEGVDTEEAQCACGSTVLRRVERKPLRAYAVAS